MKWIVFLLFSVLVIGCNRDQAGSVGSGAGIHDTKVKQKNPETGKTEEVERMDTGGEDMNITTPIDDRED